SASIWRRTRNVECPFTISWSRKAAKAAERRDFSNRLRVCLPSRLAQRRKVGWNVDTQEIRVGSHSIAEVGKKHCPRRIAPPMFAQPEPTADQESDSPIAPLRLRPALRSRRLEPADHSRDLESFPECHLHP